MEKKVTRISGDKMTAEEMAKEWNIDKKKYFLEKILTKNREAQQKDAEDNPVILDLFGTQATRKLKNSILTYEEALRDIFGKKIPARVNKKERDEDEENMLLIMHSDLHFDRAQLEAEKYLDNIYDRTLDIVHTADKIGFDRICYTNLGDYFNSDGRSETTRGTRQFNSMSEEESFGLGMRKSIEFIEALRQYGKGLETIFVPGNHDRLTMSHMAQALDLYYAGDDDITVDHSNKYRKYTNRGNSAMMFDHGDGLKEKDILSVMAKENGLKENNYSFRGHIHKNLKQLYGNLIVQTLGSPAEPSEREDSKGYVTKSDLIGIILNKERGKEIEINK